MFEWLLLLSVVAAIFLYLYEFRYWTLADKEYRQSRGTLHKITLTRIRERLQIQRETTRSKISEIQDDINNQSNLQDDELRRVASSILMRRFDPPGVGFTLREKVRSSCYNGTLESLYGAHRVQGIGEIRYNEIVNWTKKAIQQIPKVIAEGFPEKSRIIDKYMKETAKRQLILEKTRHQLDEQEELISKVDLGLDSLSRVSKDTFKRAMQGDEAAARTVMNYLVGLYPAWDSAPAWFTEASIYLVEDKI